ncbi:STE24 endopeptidase [Syntrophus gentianae]|uniref:STE24 endopeptidase n=1 Tax=Syntrophus gentianae TaxID=43775 RepID=A0A1H8A6K0_9BACT|nr:M48 family metallopeptidase [Syntrophus gentianae]SEM66193.1 STE24 endopeptidase [Syntrophus gentianae]
MISFNSLLLIFLTFFLLRVLLRELLTLFNIRHLQRHGRQVPEMLRDEIDEATLSRMTDYTVTSSRFTTFEEIVDDLITLAVLLTGLLPWLTGLLAGWKLPFVPSGLLFFGFLALASGIVGIPFDLYRTFGIEKRYGFSTMTFRLWVTDLLKNLGVSTILMGLLGGAFLSLIHYAEESWWIWSWLLFASFQLLMLWLYPVVIAPLFNRYEPIQDTNLREAVMDLANRAGLEVSGIYQVDEGKRSRHTNAYFTGLGKTRRIVLYDTLLASSPPEEILAVLAHEIGHWKKRHILKQLIFMEIASLGLFYLFSLLLSWPLLYATFGFPQPVTYAGLLLIGILVGPFFFFLNPLGAAVLRRFEREADDYSRTLTGTAIPMISALKRLAKDNLSNLFPHPLYVQFYYSHPPLLERIGRLLAPSR